MIETLNHYAGIARHLAERLLAVQEAKTAAGEKSNWKNFRPENPDRPGANWMTGLGLGSLAASVETGIGRHGLTDGVQRFIERRNLQKNPLDRFNTPEFKGSIAGNEQAKFLHDLFNRQSADTAGKQTIGRLLARNYGTLNVGDPAEVHRLYGELQKIVGSGDTEMAKRFGNLTTTHHPANAGGAQKIFDTLDKHLDRVKTNPTSRTSPQAVRQLTKLRTSFGKVESAEDLDKLKKALQNLSASVQGGKKGTPASYLFSPGMRRLLGILGKTPVEPTKVRDADKVKDMVTALGQFTKGRGAPSILRRFRRGGISSSRVKSID